MNTDTLRYAGFWPRLGSGTMDFIFWLPLVLLYNRVDHFRLAELYSFLPWVTFQLFWNVYLVQRFGGTPGKLIMKIRIRKANGEPVGYREAVLRCLPDQILGLLMAIGTIQTAMSLTDQQYLAIPASERDAQLGNLQPHWTATVYLVDQIWTWSELLVLLTNRKRRALHDFIAGTVVVYASSIPKQEAAPDEPGLLTAHDF